MDYRKPSLVLAVIRSLKLHGSWTGKTHVQKSLFLIKTATQIDVPFTFVLFKHGPYSFELETELEQMKSYLAITSEPDPNGYGVVLSPGPGSRFVDERGGLSEVESTAVGRVCRFVGQRNVAELERVATAAWIRKRERVSDSTSVAERLNKLKPHVSIPDAERADKELCTLFNWNWEGES